MSETTRRRHVAEPSSPTAPSAAGAPVDISLWSGRGFLNVRLDPRCAQAVEATARVVGQPLPLAANTFTTGEHHVCWLGPDEWLIVTGRQRAAGLGRDLTEALTGLHTAVNDISGGHVALRVSGVDARTVLAKGCTLDLHPSAFAPPQCSQTGLGKATVLLSVLDGAPTYAIIVRRSFSDYLYRWLVHAARAHGAGLGVL